ncbi:uncharacterized protein LOC129746398 [Uranotaenia lowii]|uniref:uncharacterized protein LOC129746398 n=1 Tax=Uranotaenia lowii TaxID=190385 RepID=UPI0024787DD2|nr:uncharacterized protein LOC129746398 [Uranotaenia lowii]
MIRSRSSAAATVIVPVILSVFLWGSLVTSGRVMERFKTRQDERMIRRHRARVLREMNGTTGDELPPTVNLLRISRDDGVVGSNSSQVATAAKTSRNNEDYPDMVIDESDIAEAALGQRFRYFANRRSTLFEQNVIFRFYHNGNKTKTTALSAGSLLSGTDCSTTEKFAIIAHGWHENCYETFWVKDLQDNLNVYRGGCIICMDYSTFASNGYTYLFRRFNDLSAVLLKFIRTLQYEGVSLDNLYMFGFSFGAQLALDAGNQVGFNLIEAIDTCDMAGPGFDADRFFKGVNFRGAAKNVQCIHTSTDKGTKMTNKCHQNWRMGQCGFFQLGAGKPPLGSHGLCPVYYNLAFKENFYAQEKPGECGVLRDPTADYPTNFKMGYMERRKSQVRGELFAQTSNHYPFALGNELF